MNKNTNLLNLEIEKKIGQLFFIGISGEEYDKQTGDIITEVSPGGVCFFARNTKSAQKVRTLTQQLSSALPFQPFLSVDQEGGLVDRLRRIVEPIPSAKEISKHGILENASKLAKLTAEVIRILGFNMNFAPVVDVTNEERNSFVMNNQQRTFGESKYDAFNFSKTYIDSLQNAGVLGCLKHFPGIGAVEFDPHEELPSVKLNKSTIYEIDLYPFMEHLKSDQIDAIMTGHVTFPETDLQELDSNGKLLPSSLSPKIVTGLLRDELNFDGLILTDDLEMGAIINNYGIGKAAVMAFQAGSDLLLICNNSESVREAYRAVMKAFEDGFITEQKINRSLERIEKVRSKLQPPLDFNEDRLNELSLEIKELKSIL